MDNPNAEKIYQIMQRFQKIRAGRKPVGGMPHGEIMMLKRIRMNSSDAEGITISALSELMEITKPAVSQIINALEDKGYVERVTRKNDRRLVYVRLTEYGEECLNREFRLMMEKMNRVFAQMGEKDTEELLRLMEKLFAIIMGSRLSSDKTD